MPAKKALDKAARRVACQSGSCTAYDLALRQGPDDAVSRMLGLFMQRLQGYFRAYGRLIGSIETGEVFDQARFGLGIQTFHGALRAFFNRRVDEDFDKFAVAN